MINPLIIHKMYEETMNRKRIEQKETEERLLNRAIQKLEKQNKELREKLKEKLAKMEKEEKINK